MNGDSLLHQSWFLILTFYNCVDFLRACYRPSRGSKRKRSKGVLPLMLPWTRFRPPPRQPAEKSFQRHCLHVFTGFCCLTGHSKTQWLITTSICICSRFQGLHGQFLSKLVQWAGWSRMALVTSLEIDRPSGLRSRHVSGIWLCQLV